MESKHDAAPCHFGLQSGSGGGCSLTPADEQSLLVSPWNYRGRKVDGLLAGLYCFKKEDYGLSRALSSDTPPPAPLIISSFGRQATSYLCSAKGPKLLSTRSFTKIILPGLLSFLETVGTLEISLFSSNVINCFRCTSCLSLQPTTLGDPATLRTEFLSAPGVPVFISAYKI